LFRFLEPSSLLLFFCFSLCKSRVLPTTALNKDVTLNVKYQKRKHLGIENVKTILYWKQILKETNVRLKVIPGVPLLYPPPPRYLLPCTHVMLSQRRAVREADVYGKCADKFLSLIPECCRLSAAPPGEREDDVAFWGKGKPVEEARKCCFRK
jgi:hypothetical protein